MKDSMLKWLVGVAGVIVIGAISIYGIISVKHASEPEIDRSKPPQSFFDSYKKPSNPAPAPR